MTSESIIDRLDDKNVLITGGTKGLGEATARLIAKLGANVLITGRDEESAERIRKSAPDKVSFRRVELEDRTQVLEFVKWLDSNYQKIDVLINNASRSSKHDIVTIPIEEWDRMIHLNITAPFLLSKWAAKNMMEHKTKGKIIVIGAIQAIFPMGRAFAYATCKGALISMVRSMAADLGEHGIQAMSVLPGPFYVKGGEPPASFDNKAATLIGRMGRPLEMARLLAFLASDNSSFMTGNTIVIDGGRIISRKPDPEEILKDDYW